MYEIDALVGTKYVYVYEGEDLRRVNMVLLELSLKNIPSRILKDGLVMAFLDGSMYQYNRFVQQYIFDENLNNTFNNNSKRTR